MTDPIEVIPYHEIIGRICGYAGCVSFRRCRSTNPRKCHGRDLLAAAGLKVLPEEPSGAMNHAGAETIYGRRIGKTITAVAAHKEARRVWRAMWRAAAETKPKDAA